MVDTKDLKSFGHCGCAGSSPASSTKSSNLILEDFFINFVGKNLGVMKYRFRTQGTCSQMIEFDITDGVLANVTFYGGCDGNLKGISKLVEGMPVEDVISRLEGVRCGMKTTSCPDQLAQALKQALAQ